MKRKKAPTFTDRLWIKPNIRAAKNTKGKRKGSSAWRKKSKALAGSFRRPKKYPGMLRGPHQYQSWNSDLNEIRLLQLPLLEARDYDQGTASSTSLESRLIHVPLGECPEYEALSYRWSEKNDEVEMLIDHHLVPISMTLMSVLQALRLPHNQKLVWVDALCINQKDDKERNEQVSKMRNIYSHAAHVVAWLGEGEFPSLAFSLIRDLYAHIDDSIYIENAIVDAHRRLRWKALVDILALEYWKRIWIIQEVNSARKLSLRYGHDTIDWEHFAAVQSKVSLAANARTYDPGTDLNLWWGIANGGPGVLVLPSWNPEAKSEFPDLSKVLSFFNSHRATDGRDMVYALVGLTNARDDPRMQIDYSRSVRQVYINLVDYVFKKEIRLDIICAKFTFTSISRLPSWTPDWGASSFRSVRSLTFRPPDIPSFSASQDLPAQADIDVWAGRLNAQGFRVDSVSILGNANGFGPQYYHLERTVLAVLEYYALAMPPSEDEIEAYDEGFTKTIICDTAGEDPALLKKILGAFLHYAPHFGVRVPEQTQPPIYAHEPWVEAWMSLAYGYLYGRKFFISKQGVMGLCPKYHEEGDFIAILIGCAVPVLLRPSGGSYKLVGDVYLHGYMYGIAIDELNEGKFELETFEIK